MSNGGALRPDEGRRERPPMAEGRQGPAARSFSIPVRVSQRPLVSRRLLVSYREAIDHQMIAATIFRHSVGHDNESFGLLPASLAAKAATSIFSLPMAEPVHVSRLAKIPNISCWFTVVSFGCDRHRDIAVAHRLYGRGWQITSSFVFTRDNRWGRCEELTPTASWAGTWFRTTVVNYSPPSKAAPLAVAAGIRSSIC